MKAGSHSMPEVCFEARATSHLVQIEVSPTHPLLLLKRALPWEVITAVMTRQWRQNGKNVDGGPGLPWDVSLYVPLVVLMLIKGFDSPKRREAPSFTAGMDRHWARWAQCPRAQ